jgi:chloramphenicol 3-O phosphotransferase
MATILLLNGIGSAGKSSIARAVQSLAPHYLHVQMDAFLDMIPPSSFGKPEGLIFESSETDGHPTIAIHAGPLVATAMRAFRASVAAMANEGIDLVVDDVMFGPEWAEYARLLTGHHVVKIGILCPLDILEAREAARGDRAIGLARGQWGRVHEGIAYDLTIDSSVTTPEAAARSVLRHLASHAQP